MGLSEYQVKMIKQSSKEVLGDDCAVFLFGSRVDDFTQGGDIDLLIQTSHPVTNPAKALAQIEAKIIMRLGDQKIDILLDAPNLEALPILDIAHQMGVKL